MPYSLHFRSSCSEFLCLISALKPWFIAWQRLKKKFGPILILLNFCSTFKEFFHVKKSYFSSLEDRNINMQTTLYKEHQFCAGCAGTAPTCCYAENRLIWMNSTIKTCLATRKKVKRTLLWLVHPLFVITHLICTVTASKCAASRAVMRLLYM
jgi:hypothetical protein